MDAGTDGDDGRMARLVSPTTAQQEVRHQQDGLNKQYHCFILQTCFHAYYYSLLISFSLLVTTEFLLLNHGACLIAG
jgi:hypothetical protein